MVKKVEKLNVPRIHFYDVSLVIAAESAKFRQKDFSDCHWATLLLLDYKASCYTKETYEKDKKSGWINGHAMKYSSALEMVLRMYVNQGATSAKKLAKKLESEGEKFPPWMKLPTPDKWKLMLSGPPPRFRFDINGFICGKDERPLDGD